MTHDHTTIANARTMVLTHGGITTTMFVRLCHAGYSPAYISALINIWKGSNR
jgi:hypothetical protein